MAVILNPERAYDASGEYVHKQLGWASHEELLEKAQANQWEGKSIYDLLGQWQITDNFLRPNSSPFIMDAFYWDEERTEISGMLKHGDIVLTMGLDPLSVIEGRRKWEEEWRVGYSFNEYLSHEVGWFEARFLSGSSDEEPDKRGIVFAALTHKRIADILEKKFQQGWSNSFNTQIIPVQDQSDEISSEMMVALQEKIAQSMQQAGVLEESITDLNEINPYVVFARLKEPKPLTWDDIPRWMWPMG